MSDLRITPEAVLEAYRKTGLHPARLTFAARIKQVLCGCQIAALYLAEHPEDLRCTAAAISRRAESLASKRFGGYYVMPFTVGFDSPERLESIYGTERCRQGYRDGQAVAAAVERELGGVLGS